MGSKNISSTMALFFCINFLFFTFSSACNCPKPKPPPPPPPTPTPAPPTATCPRDALKLGVCTNVLSGLLNVTVGHPPVAPCCTLIDGLVDLEAAVCLCTAIKANILGINLNLPLSLSLLLNVCSKKVPKDFQCA